MLTQKAKQNTLQLFIYYYFILQFLNLFLPKFNNSSFVGNYILIVLITFVLFPNHNNNKGGGSAGTNTLYQLAKRNVKAVLLERAQLTAGTTWHTAGLGLLFL